MPLDLFAPPPLPAAAPCDAAMDRSLEVVRRRREAGTLLRRPRARSRTPIIDDLARAGYWGMLIDPEYGGQGAPFARYARFHTRMATLEEMVAGMGVGPRLHRRRRSARSLRHAGAEAAVPAPPGQRRGPLRASP